MRSEQRCDSELQSGRLTFEQDQIELANWLDVENLMSLTACCLSLSPAQSPTPNHNVLFFPV